MGGRFHTTLVVGGATSLLLAWEVWTLSNGSPNDTISEIIWAGTRATPLVPFGFGVLMGHWFFPRGWNLKENVMTDTGHKMPSRAQQLEAERQKALAEKQEAIDKEKPPLLEAAKAAVTEAPPSLRYHVLHGLRDVLLMAGAAGATYMASDDFAATLGSHPKLGVYVPLFTLGGRLLLGLFAKWQSKRQ